MNLGNKCYQPQQISPYTPSEAAASWQI